MAWLDFIYYVAGKEGARNHIKATWEKFETIIWMQQESNRKGKRRKSPDLGERRGEQEDIFDTALHFFYHNDRFSFN